VFSFESYWSIEEDWDGGFVEVSTDSGVNWTALDDLGSYFEQNTLNDNNPSADWVLTGDGEGKLEFDLSAYKNQTILLRLRYATDTAVAYPGWWGDDFLLADGATTLFADDVEGGAGTWVTSTWQIVPFTENFPQYYLVEWRNLSGFDRGLVYPYQTVYSDEDEWGVERVPYQVPGMLVYYRNTSYGFDYSLTDSLLDPPSIGPKHGLTMMDSHPFPQMWDEAQYVSGQNVRLSDRIQTYDAAFTLEDTDPFTLDRTNIDTGDVLETKTFGSRPAVNVFRDANGYYPGLWYNPDDDSFYYWNAVASAVVPAQDSYTTRITDADNQLLSDFYGLDLGIAILGSGNPGEDNVEYGLHLQILSQATDGSWGLIRAWNSPTMEIYFPMMYKAGNPD